MLPCSFKRWFLWRAMHDLHFYVFYFVIINTNPGFLEAGEDQNWIFYFSLHHNRFQPSAESPTSLGIQYTILLFALVFAGFRWFSRMETQIWLSTTSEKPHESIYSQIYIYIYIYLRGWGLGWLYKLWLHVQRSNSSHDICQSLPMNDFIFTKLHVGISFISETGLRHFPLTPLKCYP